MTDDLARDFDLVRETAREAGNLALSYWGQGIRSETKADGTAITEADRAVDALFAQKLREARPDYGWLSEESAEHESRLSARCVFVLDPIDGTQSFIQARDDWTVALSLVEDGEVVLSAVVNPVRGEFYEARRGGGAFLNGQPISVGTRDALAGSTLMVSPWHLKGSRWTRPWPEVNPVHICSMTYRLCLVASGVGDASFALPPKWEWDVAPGSLLVAEAGGTVTDANGKAFRFNNQSAKVPGYLAAGPLLHPLLAERMGDAL
ncbi:3'(2'),5'-bisphosphate nucleotidase CysQ [Rhodomicrobium sp. Az07]|uniref:3'(2'),5'-bisphosphate nucleotidase CysQ n=1 Tax=Rhodomicrobium sp. Az07 TaxID=2839034 RepID=UPI001BE7D307|nr:3'(2'),5'-bisphosphate nucleotidase CysQ [Rhodomicrobium sp. Az07]MBT3070596.1 3'(2'),5'-bisphosphate nucleotidase CysQ [Rhodomicrobium sp. Az07]